MAGSARKVAWSVGVFVVGLGILALAATSASMREARSREDAAQAVVVSNVASALWSAAERDRQALREYRRKVAVHSAAMDPKRIAEPEGASKARDAVDRFRAACAELAAARNASDMELLRQVDARSGGERTKQVREALERIDAHAQRMRENQRTQADALYALVTFLSSREGRISFDNRGPLFRDDADLAEYNRLAQEARALAAEETRLADGIELATRNEFARLARP
ncbi:hypothetical protein [Noviluteimonas dokdonensis]|uniref:hypothetical protein n=1 Tax=Noviluteimonas dokdonensis TaxID=414050 RepID=UPI0005633819|nr:hypothetical protein [Lysobacter dokdonensis]